MRFSMTAVSIHEPIAGPAARTDIPLRQAVLVPTYRFNNNTRHMWTSPHNIDIQTVFTRNILFRIFKEQKKVAIIKHS